METDAADVELLKQGRPVSCVDWPQLVSADLLGLTEPPPALLSASVGMKLLKLSDQQEPDPVH